MTAIEEIDDYIEYLVEEKGVRSIFELSKPQAAKLAYWVLVQNDMYKKLTHLMQKSIYDYIKISAKKKIR